MECPVSCNTYSVHTNHSSHRIPVKQNNTVSFQFCLICPAGSGMIDRVTANYHVYITWQMAQSGNIFYNGCCLTSLHLWKWLVQWLDVDSCWIRYYRFICQDSKQSSDVSMGYYPSRLQLIFCHVVLSCPLHEINFLCIIMPSWLE